MSSSMWKILYSSNAFPFQLTAGNKYNRKQFVNKHTMVPYAKSLKYLYIYT